MTLQYKFGESYFDVTMRDDCALIKVPLKDIANFFCQMDMKQEKVSRFETTNPYSPLSSERTGSQPRRVKFEELKSPSLKS